MRKVGCFGMLVALAAIVAMFLFVQSWGGRGPARQTTTVLIRDGETLSDASRDLEKAGAINSARRFVLLAKLLGSSAPIKAGEYRLPPHVSQSNILKLMQGGETLQTGSETVGALRDELIARGEPYASALARGKAVRLALDQVMCDEAAVLREGSEVAFFPPVTGG